MRYVFILVVLLAMATSASAQIAPDASQVFLKKSCLDEGGQPIPNCVTTIAEVNDFLNTGPRTGDPFVVEIGPGTFSGTFFCSSTIPVSNVLFRGAGRRNTVIDGGALPGVQAFALQTPCEDLEFRQMTVKGGRGAHWLGPGSSTWIEVDLRAEAGVAVGWDSDSAIACNGASHRFFNSTIRVESTFVGTGLRVACGDVEMFGGDVRVSPDAAASGVLALSGVRAEGGNVTAYGVRVHADAAMNPTANLTGLATGLTAIAVSGGSTLEVHGGDVRVEVGSSPGQTATALDVEAGSAAAMEGTAFLLDGGPNGTATRLSGEGTIRSPFLWEPRADPPDVVSKDGQDLFVETDCDSTGNCTDSQGTDTHLMIYNPFACPPPGEPWFDTVVGRCRGT